MGWRTIGELLKAAQERLDRLQPRDAFEEARRGALIIDTRCQEARAESGTIPGSSTGCRLSRVAQLLERTRWSAGAEGTRMARRSRQSDGTIRDSATG